MSPKTAYSFFLVMMSSKVHFAKRLLCHTRTPSFCALTLFFFAERDDCVKKKNRQKKGIMKIERQRAGIMIVLALMEVWR